MTADPSSAARFDRSLLRFLRARVPFDDALNDDLPPVAGCLPPAVLAGELLSALCRPQPRARLRLGRPDVSDLLGRLRGLDLDQLGSQTERLAFWINLHNAVVLDGVHHFGVSRSVREVPGFYRRAAYRIGAERFSAEEIEHGILRGNQPHLAGAPEPFGAEDPRRRHVLRPVDPRVHFALHCATRSCPPLTVYDTAGLDGQLDGAAAGFINGGAVEWDEETGGAVLSAIFASYPDFGDLARLSGFLGRYLARGDRAALICRAIAEGRVRYQALDWSMPGEGGADAQS